MTSPCDPESDFLTIPLLPSDSPTWHTGLPSFSDHEEKKETHTTRGTKKVRRCKAPSFGNDSEDERDEEIDEEVKAVGRHFSFSNLFSGGGFGGGGGPRRDSQHGIINTAEDHSVLKKRVFCRFIGGCFIVRFSTALCRFASPFIKSDNKPPEWLYHVPNLQILSLSEYKVDAYVLRFVDLSRLPPSLTYLDIRYNLYALCKGYSSFGDTLPNLTFLRREVAEHEKTNLNGTFGNLKKLRFLDIGDGGDISGISTVSSLRCVGIQRAPLVEGGWESWEKLTELIYCMPPSVYNEDDRGVDLSFLSKNTSLLSLFLDWKPKDYSSLSSFPNLRCVGLAVNFQPDENNELPSPDCLSSLSLLRHLRTVQIEIVTLNQYRKYPPGSQERVEVAVEKFKEKTREILHTLPDLLYTPFEISDDELDKKMKENQKRWRALFESIKRHEPASSILSQYDPDGSLLWYGTIQYDFSQWKKCEQYYGIEQLALDYPSSPFLAAVEAGHVDLVKAVLEKYPLTHSASLSPPHSSSPSSASFVNRFVFDSAPLNVCLRALSQAASLE